MTIQRWLFESVSNLNARNHIDWIEHIYIYFMGLRFDLLVMAFCVLPLCIFVAVKVPLKLKIYFSKIYFACLWLGISVLNFINLPYFALYHKLMNQPEWNKQVVMQTFSVWLTGQGFFLKLMALLFVLLVCLLGLFEIMRISADEQNSSITRIVTSLKDKLKFNFLSAERSEVLVAIALVFIIGFCARGKIGAHHLRREDSHITQYSSWNELALNAAWSLNKDDR